MALVGILMSTQLANAQQNMLMVGNNGKINAISVSSVDYATFNANDKPFTISNDGIEDVGTTFITAACTVGLSPESNVKTLSVTPEVGVCYSKYNSVPTIDDDDSLSLGTELKSYTFTLKSLMSGTTYYFRTYIKWAGGVFYGEVVKAKTLTVAVDNSKFINGHKFVDLGLPSGLLWAETNIGAETADDDGYYYAWGETSIKGFYNWDSYKYGTSLYNFTKYNSSDGKTTLDSEDDAAYVNWGYSCRMPTRKEFAELLDKDNCYWISSQTTSSGVYIKGYQVISVKNGNSIFLPASGYLYLGTLCEHGTVGGYWSSTLDSGNSNDAYDLFFSSSSHRQHGTDRFYGRTVRPVAEP